MAVRKLIKQIEVLLQASKNEAIAQGQERYLKNVVLCYGIKATPLRQLINNHYKTHLASLELDTKLNLATDLVSSKYFEAKQFGIQILSKNVKSLATQHVSTLEKMFDNIYDWGTCDSFSSKVMGEIIKSDPKIVPFIVTWKDSSNLWKQRSSCVSFLKSAKQGKYKKNYGNLWNMCSE